ncbi:anti-sigma factor family protein [Paenibacillus pinistramenti]|uniref:anti-sigma factor family protein n=1 Tax=Paenibacillus pinistramenti TaxID=1768003 RepID=UPI0011089833|nr:zf-HC2 domain-containing protein [Paenibacillus pinistramenti]
MHPEEQLSAYLDGELNPGERLLVEKHLQICPSCRSLLEEMKELQLAFSMEMFSLSEPDHLETKIMQAVAAANTRKGIEKLGILIPSIAGMILILLAISVGPILIHILQRGWVVGRALLYTLSQALNDMPVIAVSSMILLLAIILGSLFMLRRLLHAAAGSEMRGDW